jgi:peptide/nickel transport system permease protein
MHMILRRILQLVFVLVGITLVTFLLVHMVPGDPARVIAGDRAKPETLEAIRQSLGLDKPLWQQFVIYAGNLVSGDIGMSLRYKRPVAELIGQYLWPTLFLTGYVICLAVPPSVALAIASARRPGSVTDQVIRLIGVDGMAIPVFWLGIMMSRFFGVSLGWFPVSGYGRNFVGHLHHLFLPALSTAIWIVPVLVQSLRAALIEKSSADFVTAARAQGASESEIFWRTVLPNAVLIGGTIVVETVYAVPGLGTLMINSLLARDYHVIQGLTVMFAATTVAVTFLVDLLSAAIDPRARL